MPAVTTTTTTMTTATTTMTTTTTTMTTTTPAMTKLIAAACLISVSACSASGMSMGLGAGVTIVGGSLLLNQQEVPDCDPLIRATTGCVNSAGVEASNALSTVAGLTLVGFGVLLMGLGAWGAASDKDAPEPLGLALVPAGPSQSPASGLALPPPTTSPTTSPAAHRADDGAQAQKLAVHIQLAAHANRCAAAVYLLNRLRALNEVRAGALVQSDAEVARCAQARTASLRG